MGASRPGVSVPELARLHIDSSSKNTAEKLCEKAILVLVYIHTGLIRWIRDNPHRN
jgi:hypothetical protein